MKEHVLATGGVLGALAASTCCIIPLALASVGVSGAWIGSLTTLAPYQPLFLAFAIACLGAGFWLVYARSPKDCETGACAGPNPGRLIRTTLWVKGILWLGATLVALAASVDYGARIFL